MVDYLLRCVIYSVVFVFSFLLKFVQIVIPPIFWLLRKTRLLYPLIAIIIVEFINYPETWFINKIINSELFSVQGSVFSGGDVFIIAVLVISVLLFLQEVIQIAIPNFTWISFVRKVIKLLAATVRKILLFFAKKQNFELQ